MVHPYISSYVIIYKLTPVNRKKNSEYRVGTYKKNEEREINGRGSIYSNKNACTILISKFYLSVSIIEILFKSLN